MTEYSITMGFGTSYGSKIEVSTDGDESISITHTGNSSKEESLHITPDDVDVLIEMLQKAKENLA